MLDRSQISHQSLLYDAQSVTNEPSLSPSSPTLQGSRGRSDSLAYMEKPLVDQEVPRDAWGRFMYYFRFFWTFFHGFGATFGGLVFVSLVVGDTTMTNGTRIWWSLLCISGGCYTVYEVYSILNRCGIMVDCSNTYFVFHITLELDCASQGAQPHISGIGVDGCSKCCDGHD